MEDVFNQMANILRPDENRVTGWKTLGEDLLVFKRKNDCLTINDGIVVRLEIDGEDMDNFPDLESTFTPEEIEEWIAFYWELQRTKQI